MKHLSTSDQVQQLHRELWVSEMTNTHQFLQQLIHESQEFSGELDEELLWVYLEKYGFHLDKIFPDVLELKNHVHREQFEESLKNMQMLIGYTAQAIVLALETPENIPTIH